VNIHPKNIWGAIVTTALIVLAWNGVNLARDIFVPKSTQVVQVGPAILEQIHHVNKQIFVEHYLAVDVSYAETPQGWLQPLKNLGVKQEYAVLLRGRVPAGIDLTGLSPESIWVSPDGQRAQVILPSPRIFEENIAVDFEHSRILTIADTCPGFLCPTGQLQAYQTQMEPEARTKLIVAAKDEGILTQAATDAQTYYEQLLNALGIAEVRVIVRGYSS